MKIIIEIIIFIIFFAFTVWWFNVVILPLFYGVPRAIYLSLVKKEIKAKAIFAYLLLPVIWSLIILFICFLLVRFLPSLAKYLYDNWGFHWGQIFAVIYFLYYAFLTSNGRKDLRDDFQEFTLPYRK